MESYYFYSSHPEGSRGDKAGPDPLAWPHQPDLRMLLLASPASSLEGGKRSSPSRRWHCCSVRLLETEAPQKDNQMAQSGPSPRFGKPEIKLQYETNIGNEIASAFGLESWSDTVQFLSQEQPMLFKKPEPESKGIKVKMILVSVPAISSVEKQHLEKSKPKKIHCLGWRVPGSPKDKLPRPQEL